MVTCTCQYGLHVHTTLLNNMHVWQLVSVNAWIHMDKPLYTACCVTKPLVCIIQGCPSNCMQVMLYIGVGVPVAARGCPPEVSMLATSWHCSICTIQMEVVQCCSSIHTNRRQYCTMRQSQKQPVIARLLVMACASGLAYFPSRTLAQAMTSILRLGCSFR